MGMSLAEEKTEDKDEKGDGCGDERGKGDGTRGLDYWLRKFEEEGEPH